MSYKIAIDGPSSAGKSTLAKGLAKELGFVCLAEGAESKTQVDKLRTLGCEIIQGYYYSKPIPLSDYEKKYLN